MIFPRKKPPVPFVKGYNKRNVFEPSRYAVILDRLRSKIFGEPVGEPSSRNLRIVRLLEKMPMEDSKHKVEYFPPHPMFHYLMKTLRMHGLYRDEHLDFREEMARLKVLRGKGRPLPGQGKRARLSQGKNN